MFHQLQSRSPRKSFTEFQQLNTLHAYIAPVRNPVQRPTHEASLEALFQNPIATVVSHPTVEECSIKILSKLDPIDLCRTSTSSKISKNQEANYQEGSPKISRAQNPAGEENTIQTPTNEDGKVTKAVSKYSGSQPCFSYDLCACRLYRSSSMGSKTSSRRSLR